MLKKQTIKKPSDAGFTMIELAVVLIVIAILTGAAMLGYSSFQNSGKTAALRIQITKLMDAAKAYGQSIGGNPYGTYYNIGTYAAQGYNGGQNALLPSSYTPSGVVNAFGGQGVISAGPSTSTFTITETGLSSDVCQNLYLSFSGHVVSGSGCSSGTLTLIFQ